MVHLGTETICGAYRKLLSEVTSYDRADHQELEIRAIVERNSSIIDAGGESGKMAV